jgi:hypothetical protein
MDLDEIIATGELFKQGRGRKSWNLRKFVLSGPFLNYFDNDNVKKGCLDITGCTLELRTPEECAMPPAKHAFAIIGPSKYLLVSASNEENRNLWMELLRQQINEYRDETRKYTLRNESVLASGMLRRIGMISWITTPVQLVITNYPRYIILEGVGSTSTPTSSTSSSTGGSPQQAAGTGYVKDVVQFTREKSIRFEKVS